MMARPPKFLTDALVWLVLPLAHRWVRREERRILKAGRRLTAEERGDAVAAGVADPDTIRLIIISPLPSPGGLLLQSLGGATSFAVTAPVGMALGRGIYLHPRVANDRRTFLHECVHVAQYERLGGIRPFLRRYLTECLRDGYEDSAMEVEANQTANRICRAGRR